MSVRSGNGYKPQTSRRENNLRYLTNSTTSIKPDQPSSSKTAPPLKPPKTPPKLMPPFRDETFQSDDEIIFLGHNMGDSKDVSNSNVRRDNSRGRDRRSGGHSDRHATSDRRDGQRPGGSGQKRHHNESSRYNSGNAPTNSNFIPQFGSGDFRSPPSGAFTQEIPKKKFTTRCRLFVGNLPNEMKEEEFKALFIDFGEINEVFLSGKGFGFLRLDTRAHAESAKEALDGKTVMGRQLRVRFAVHGATIRVKELSPVVSNEMLYNTFNIFGEVERAVHIVDERGKATGEGIVEFERKTSAQDALRSIEERVFIMTAQSHPIIAEMMEPKDEEDGLAERMIQRTTQTMKEREVPPHFADDNSFEYMYGF